jgi:hypothetical protein
MTLAASTTTVSYVGNGSANTFSFSYLVFLQTHLVVSIAAPSPSTTVYTLNLGTDFTVSGLSPNGVPAKAGSITLVNNGQAWLTGANLTTGYIITISRVVPFAQTYSIRNQGDFYREFLEDSLDYITMELQQLETSISGFEDDIAALQAAILVLQAQIAALQAQVTPTGFILTDKINGLQYEIAMYNGVLSTEEI